MFSMVYKCSCAPAGAAKTRASQARRAADHPAGKANAEVFRADSYCQSALHRTPSGDTYTQLCWALQHRPPQLTCLACRATGTRPEPEAISKRQRPGLLLPLCRSRRDSANLGRESKRHRPRVENEMTRKLRNAATPPSDADSAPVQSGAHTGPDGTAVANGVGAAEEDDSQPAGELMDHGLAVYSAGDCLHPEAVWALSCRQAAARWAADGQQVCCGHSARTLPDHMCCAGK